MLNWTASDTMAGSMERAASGDWLRRGERFGRLVSAQHAGFLTEHDIYADGELERGPFYCDFLWPAGLGWGVGMAVPLPTGDTVCVGLERRRERGPVEAETVHRLDLIRPRLARSVLLSARLHLERARAASETLAWLGLPALVIDGRGKVLVQTAMRVAPTRSPGDAELTALWGGLLAQKGGPQ